MGIFSVPLPLPFKTLTLERGKGLKTLGVCEGIIYYIDICAQHFSTP